MAFTPVEVVVETRSYYSDRKERFEVRMHTSGPGMYPPDPEWTSLYHTWDFRDAELFRAQVLVYAAVVRGVYRGS